MTFHLDPPVTPSPIHAWRHSGDSAGSSTIQGPCSFPYVLRIYGFTDLPPPSPSPRAPRRRAPTNQVTAGKRDADRRIPMAYVFIEVDRSRPPPTCTRRYASICAPCAPDSHHHQLPAVLVHALGSYFASPHAKAMAMQVSRARRTQCHVGSAANALARTTLAR